VEWATSRSYEASAANVGTCYSAPDGIHSQLPLYTPLVRTHQCAPLPRPLPPQAHGHALLPSSVQPCGQSRLVPFYDVIWGPNPCARCSLQIEEHREITALKKSWHPECLSCIDCHRLFQAGHGPDSSFYVRDSQPVCEACNLAARLAAADRCSACGEPILTAQLTALGRPWHAQCFACAGCKTVFPPSASFFTDNEKPYCKSCNLAARRAAADRCSTCGEPILDMSVTAVGRKFHPNCLVCTACRRQFGKSEGIYARDGWPVCREHAVGPLPPAAAPRFVAGPTGSLE
jgi:hypothetical protein